MSTMTAFDRRKHHRVVVSLAIEVRDARGFLLMSTRDLSTGGVFFDRSIPREVGEKVELRFTLPGDMKAIRCDGEIANVPNRQGYGMGVRFLNLAPADEQRIAEFARAMRRKAAPQE